MNVHVSFPRCPSAVCPIVVAVSLSWVEGKLAGPYEYSVRESKSASQAHTMYTVREM